jgi:hypothetical protein
MATNKTVLYFLELTAMTEQTRDVNTKKIAH